MATFAALKDILLTMFYTHGSLREQLRSTFDEKTDKASSQQYFHYYGQLAQQQNMLQDLVRTGTYQRAMLDNHADFKDAVVLDVGAGTGILSHFALQAGAKKVCRRRAFQT